MTLATNAGEPNADDHLLHLLSQRRTDGRVVEHFVCEDCMDLVEREAGSIQVHDCQAAIGQQ